MRCVGAITAAQGLAAQSQINFTRANEYEADRVGIGILAAAGFDPNGMPAFFETMGALAGGAGRRSRSCCGPTRSPASASRNRGTARSSIRASRTHDSAELRADRERLRVLDDLPAGTDRARYYAGRRERGGRIRPPTPSSTGARWR